MALPEMTEPAKRGDPPAVVLRIVQVGLLLAAVAQVVAGALRLASDGYPNRTTAQRFWFLTTSTVSDVSWLCVLGVLVSVVVTRSDRRTRRLVSVCLAVAAWVGTTHVGLLTHTLLFGASPTERIFTFSNLSMVVGSSVDVVLACLLLDRGFAADLDARVVRAAARRLGLAVDGEPEIVMPSNDAPVVVRLDADPPR